MAGDPRHFSREPLVLTADRRFEGSVFDLADACRFARVTARWWGVEPAPVEARVENLARLAICRSRPAFRVHLSLDGSDLLVRVDDAVPRASRHGRSTCRSSCT